jgi:hypothetical protein
MYDKISQSHSNLSSLVNFTFPQIEIIIVSNLQSVIYVCFCLFYPQLSKTGHSQKKQCPDTSFRAPDTVFRVPDTVFRVPVTVFRVLDTSFRVPDAVFVIPVACFVMPDANFVLPITIFVQVVTYFEIVFIAFGGLEGINL